MRRDFVGEVLGHAANGIHSVIDPLLGVRGWHGSVIIYHERLNVPTLSKFRRQRPRGATQFGGNPQGD